MLILAHPDEAFLHAQLPCDGVGLLRLEFIINNTIGIHPMALRKFDEITDSTTREAIEQRTEGYRNKAEFFVDRLAEATAKIAAAFYPKEVIVRMSDFKSNEYANLLGGKQFEPSEENPMIGFRGASRYYHPLYQPAFELECAAIQRVRDEMGFQNVKLMIPFCRTVEEAQKVIAVMHSCGLERGKNGLQLYVMVEIPSNALLAEDFAHCFDGFSIGSNDLTQLTLGADRDSELLSDVFTPFDPAVMQLIELTLAKAKTTKTHTGLCGQAPSDYPEYARFLVQHGIDSISFNPDALLKGIENIAQAEKKNINSKQ
jgi:pyruvate,water dikinase